MLSLASDSSSHAVVVPIQMQIIYYYFIALQFAFSKVFELRARAPLNCPARAHIHSGNCDAWMQNHKYN